jgi:hypothetical protein
MWSLGISLRIARARNMTVLINTKALRTVNADECRSDEPSMTW